VAQKSKPMPNYQKSS